MSPGYIKVRHHLRELSKLEQELKGALQRCDTAQRSTRRNEQRCPVLETMGKRKRSE